MIEELKWRGLIQDMIPGTDELLSKEMVCGYIGFDPTADSLHIGNLVPIMLLVHLQRHGHKPIALIGGATGMVGDPSGKTAERQLLDNSTLDHNLKCQGTQLRKFLNFDNGENKAEMVNNYDWFKDINFLDFIRDVGKHITINYMMAKDSVKTRMETGMSFTEFSYQLVQGYDFYHLWKEKNCKLQMGGSDQWGNIVTGTELIRRKGGGEAFALTAPLIKKADGSKFGKSEGGNIWLDPVKTSPYKFYQYWLNASDEDAEKYIKVFTLLEKSEIEELISEHRMAPHERKLQKTLAKELTLTVHSEKDLEDAIHASSILFGNATKVEMESISENNLLSVFEGVPSSILSMEKVSQGIPVLDLMSQETGFLKSNGEARRALAENSLRINKEKISEDFILRPDALINNKFLILQRGKKNFFLVTVS